MRYRLTAKGRFVFTALPLLLIFSVCAVVFGVNTFLGDRNQPQNTEDPSGGPSMQHSPSPSDTQTPSGAPEITDGPATDTPETDEPPAGTPGPTDGPTLEPTETPQPTAVPIQTQTARPPTPAATVPPGKDIYELRYLVPFTRDSDTTDEAGLAEILKGILTTSDTSFVPPKMDSHYLKIEGCVAANEDPGLALSRARFVRGVLTDIGLPDSKLLDYAVEGDEVPGVKLSFMPINKPAGSK